MSHSEPVFAKIFMSTHSILSTSNWLFKWAQIKFSNASKYLMELSIWSVWAQIQFLTSSIWTYPLICFRRIKKNAFQQNYQHSIGRPSSSFVSFRVPPGTFPTGSYSTNWASKRHVEVEQGVQGRPGGANSYWNSHSKRQTDLPSTQRQAQPGFAFTVESLHRVLV